MAATPTELERRAVDQALPASPEGSGDRVARSGRAVRERRHLLLPVLHAVQDRVGWISEGALNHICRRLTVPPAEAYGVATFYGLFATRYRPPRVAHVCDDIVCRVAGSDDLVAGLERRLGPAGEGSGEVTWMPSPCLGLCEQAPAVFLQLAGDQNRVLGGADAEGVVAGVLGQTAEPDSPEPAVYGSGPLLRRVGKTDPLDLDDYRAAGGYAALARGLELGPEGIIAELVTSGLAGRGGAAFPTGRKWAAVAANPRPRYVVGNGDESEPGTFKDRILMEEDPFAVIEAMTIAGYAVGAARGYLYVRGEYPRAAAHLSAAVRAAEAAGLLGPDVMDGGFSFDIEIRIGAGAYICGEETALFNSIEGYRGEPRSKPPYPTERGLFGRPTLVNNIETLVNVLPIITEGGSVFARAGVEGATGTKLFCVSGRVTRPGLYEVAFGTTLRELLTMAGRAAGETRAVLVGGAAGTFVTPDHLDVPLTFAGMREMGGTLGSGAVVVFDGTVDLAEITLRIARFFREESCGQCVPCRVGTEHQVNLLERLLAGSGDGEVERLADVAAVMTDASICGLGQTAASAVQSALAQGLIGGGE